MGDKSQGELFPEDALALSGARSGKIKKNEHELRTEFARLEGDAHKQAKELRGAGIAHETAWDNLIPTLDDMQSLLSERGKNHDRVKRAGLPSWTQWWKEFKERNDFDACLRRVQKKLKEFRARQRAREGTEPRETLHEEHAIASEESKRFKDLQRDLMEGKKARTNLSEILVKFIAEHFSEQELQELVDRLQQGLLIAKAPPEASPVGRQMAADSLREMPG